MDNKYLDDPILNEALEDYFNKLDIVNESSNFHKMFLQPKPHMNIYQILKSHKYPGFLNLVNKVKEVDDLQYLRSDVHIGLNTYKTIRERLAKKDPRVDKYVKKGITVKDCDLTIKWFKEVVLPAISARIKELKSK
jgi:hypothetical protein